jgi:hypothetical protein
LERHAGLIRVRKIRLPFFIQSGWKDGISFGQSSSGQTSHG